MKTNDKIPVVGIIEEGSGTGYACYLSKEDGSYTYRNETYSTSSSYGAFLMTDLNGDGYSDAVKVHATGSSSSYGLVFWSYISKDVCSFKTGTSSTFTLTNPDYSASNYNSRITILKNC